MAKGDAVGTSILVTATSTAIYVPSGTTEVMVRTVFGGGGNGSCSYHFGTTGAGTLNPVIGSFTGRQLPNVYVTAVFITNSFPLVMANTQGTGQNMGFSGIQTK